MRRRWLTPLLLAAGASLGLVPACLASFDLAATPAWQGWTRAGRTTEIDVRLTSDVARPVRIVVAGAGRSVTAEIDLQAGVPERLQIPVAADDVLSITASAPGVAPVSRTLPLAFAQSPLLAVAAESGDRASLDGYHSIAIAHEALPRHASAYSSIDVLVISSSVVAALDERQWAALATHLGRCGRVVLAGPEGEWAAAVEKAAGCAGRNLVRTPSLGRLAEFLSTNPFAPVDAVNPTSLPRAATPGQAQWGYVAAATIASLALMALAVMLLKPFAWIAAPVVVTALSVTVIGALSGSTSLALWSEAESGSSVARYQAVQWHSPTKRSRTDAPLAALDGAQPCSPISESVLRYDPTSRRISTLEFDARLFRTVPVCFSGTMAVDRAIRVSANPDGTLSARNEGRTPLPAGSLLRDGRSLELPALAADATAVIQIQPAGSADLSPVAKRAASRLAPGEIAAFWAESRNLGAGGEATHWHLQRLRPQ